MYPYRSNSKRSQGGFTLIEMLVVLVIMSITTTLLVEGLGTTWRNFEKLNNQQLVVNKGLLPKKWFIDSFQGAQLYHPFHWGFTGFEESVNFITITPPGIIKAKPTNISWFLVSEGNGQTLFLRTDEGENTRVASLNGQYHFEYLVEDSWVKEYVPDSSRLPAAIKITNNENDWVYTVAGTALAPPIPPSLGLYGDHGI
ncbi:hypothetical protein BK026_11855 [Alteromonas sp. V450]|nr:hypothetical protein BK026_11855 [Alteromonas sp. V450]